MSNRPPKAAQLLDDLESIRALLGEEDHAEDAPLDPETIPVLSDIVETTEDHPLAPGGQDEAPPPRLLSEAERRRERELRAAANLILQDVIDDFVPQIEAELKRRLERLMKQSHPNLF